MNSHQSFVVLMVVVTMTMCSAHIGGGQSLFQDVNPQVYCGRSLARILALVCYDERPAEKRSDAGTMYNAILSPYYKEQEGQIGWPWIAPHKARNMGLPSRGKRYVVNECCEKACSINELSNYC